MHLSKRAGRLTTVTAVVVLSSGVGWVSLAPLARLATGTPSPPAGLPACRSGDESASHSGYSDWADTILDPEHRLPTAYEPPDLAVVKNTGGKIRLRSFAIADLNALLAAGAHDGASVSLNSGYRSYNEQLTIYRSMSADLGARSAAELVAAPGHSEHQLGTAIDFGGDHDWLAANAWRFGFVSSYPAGRSPEWTCYAAEPWHFRYFGRDRAAQIVSSGVSPREWLWSFGQHPTS